MKKQKQYIVFFLLVSVAAAFLLIGGIAARYMHTETLEAKVVFSAGLTEELKLIEHEAKRQPDGSYKLSSKETGNNQYTVMPGVDIPKDPQIVMTDKSAVDAYVYIEVTGDCPDGLTYNMESCWKPLENVVGVNGGKVYVYSDTQGNPVVLDENFKQPSIGIIEGNRITVSHRIHQMEDFSLSFYAYMAQISTPEENLTAGEVFRKCFMSADRRQEKRI